MRLLPVLLLVATLALVTPVHAQPRDEAPDAMPAGPTTSSVAEELTTEAPAEKPPEKKPAPKKEKQVVKKAEPKKEKKVTPKPEKKPEPVKEEPKPIKEETKPEAKKQTPVVSSGKDPVIVINPCTGDVSEELVAPQAKTRAIQPGKDLKCLTARQCDALCRVGESFGEGGGSPHLSPRGDIVYGTDAFTGFDDCVEACGPKCK